MPLHPHNAALQVWLELGAPGAVLFALLVALVWNALARVEWPPLFAAAAGASLTIGVCRVLCHLRHMAGMVARHLVVLAFFGFGHGAHRESGSKAFSLARRRGPTR